MSRQELVQAFILEVQAHPAIWNKTSQDFKDARMKENAFEEILANLTISFSNTDLVQKLLSSVEEARKFWRNIKDTYVRKKRETKGKSGAGLNDVKGKKDWPFFYMLQFLDQSDLYDEGTVEQSSSLGIADENLEEHHADEEQPASDQDENGNDL